MRTSCGLLPGEIPAGKGLGVEPIELLVVVERVVVEEEKALCLGEARSSRSRRYFSSLKSANLSLPSRIPRKIRRQVPAQPFSVFQL